MAGNKRLEEKTTAKCREDNSCQEQILHRVEMRMGVLDYRPGYRTKETVARIDDEMDYQRAVLAHQISDNLVSFYSMYTGPSESIEGVQMGDLVVWEDYPGYQGYCPGGYR